MKKPLLTLLCFYTCIVCSSAQKDERKIELMKWGKVAEADLKMTVYAPDTAAEAVVLGKFGDITIEGIGEDIKTIFKYHRRVKLLKKSSFENEGNISIPYYPENKYHVLSGIKAQVIQPDGSIVEVSKKDIVDEKTTKEWHQKKFAFPSLKEGSIIEYQYEMHIKQITRLREWYFQENIPVRQSVLTYAIPEFFDYVYLSQGSINIYQAPTKTESRHFSTSYGRVNYGLSMLVADTVPGLKTEGYITTMDDYLARVRFQLNRINYPDGRVEQVLTTWQKAAEQLSEHEYLGQQYNVKRYYGDVWKAVKPMLKEIKTSEDTLNAIHTVYYYLAKNINWDENFSEYADESLDACFKKKKANSGALNMMLIACLNEAGIDAKPMLVSTRDHGKVTPTYPILDQFNHLLCFTKVNGKPLLLDVGSMYRPAGLPRIPSLNQQGWVLDKKNPHWETITPSVSSETVMANFTLQDDGSLKGAYLKSYKGYGAVIARESAGDDEKYESIRKDIAKDFPDIQIDSVTTANRDNLKESFKNTIYCTIPNAATVAGDMIYIKPTLKTDFDENPFKQSKRDYAVDFPYPIKDNYILNLTFPSGYTVEELPKAASATLGDNAASFSYLYSKKDDGIQLVVKFQLNRCHFEPDEYAHLKAFFDNIASKSGEQIVLKKKAE